MLHSSALDVRVAKCPHCKGVAASFLDKLLLGPTEPKPCKSCGALVAMSWWSVVLVVAFPIAVLLIGLMLRPGGSFQAHIAMTLAAAVVGIAVIDLFVPLVRRDGQEQPAPERQEPSLK